MVEKGARAKPGPGERVHAGCCKVEAIVSVDERGQMVLPKDVRERAGIRPGDKFAITLMRKDDEVCCIAMVRAEEVSELVRGMLGPVMREVP